MTNNLVGYARKCNQCSKGMDEGYVICGGEEYYCSDECLHKNYTAADWNELSKDDDDENYWTVWEDPFDIQYLLIDGILTNIEIN